MPDLSLQELSQQLREAENPAPAHIELIQAIEALHQATLPFRQFSGSEEAPHRQRPEQDPAHGAASADRRQGGGPAGPASGRPLIRS